MSDFAEWTRKAAALRFDPRPLIDGHRCASSPEEGFDCFNPSNGARLYSLPAGTAADADQAVRAAREAYERGHWSGLSPVIRKAILLALADRVETRREELALLDSLEMGKPIAQALGDVTTAAHVIRYFAEYADKLEGATTASPASVLQYQRREPRGVIAAIVAWNYPLPNAALKIAPALATGNSVVLKPSELASSSALRLAELALECGVPPGVLNVVPGLGRTVGEALAAHAGVDLIAFTGSTATGRKLMATAARSLKPLQLECGGKSATIVFPDCADPASVARDAVQRIFVNQGQLCVAGTRLIAHAAIKDELLAHVAACARELTIGNALDPTTTFGPLASRARQESVLAHCERARCSGATVVHGGHAARAESGGYFVEPTIFDAVTADMPVAREDIFGPVLAVLLFTDTEEAITLANASDYGLSAVVWSTNVPTCQQMVRRLSAGRVTILSAAPDPGAPVIPMAAEPFGQSGFGAEAGRQGIETYTRIKAVEVHA